MQKYTPLFCREVEGEQAITRGTIYFASPNKHLIVKNDIVKLGYGAEENHWRPSIDVLFRSAAASFDGYTIGIILTGMLDDGTVGMSAIKRCGGSTIVQDPNEAEYPDMPLSVLKEIEVDYCVPVTQIGAMIATIIQNKKVVHTLIPADILKEVELSEKGIGTIDELKELGDSSVLTCPDCGGVLFEIKNDAVTRYKCHTGHSYTVNELLGKQYKNVESSLWVALRTLEERRNLLSQLAEKNAVRGFHRTATDYKEKINELQDHVDNIKQVLFATEKENNL